MLKEYGEAVMNADGMTILRLSGIVSYSLHNNVHGPYQTQMQPQKEIWRMATVSEMEGGRMKICCTKFNFCFQPHPDGGYEIVANGATMQLSPESSELIRDMLDQYRKHKKRK